MNNADGPLTGFDAIERLTDDTGMMQHSRFSVPDRNFGYCIDDNARALLLMTVADDLPEALRQKYGLIYAAFIQHAWNPATGKFRNFMGFDRQWLESEGSDDSNGRTYWALATARAKFPDAGVREWASALIDDLSQNMGTVASPRAAAFYVLGAEELCRSRIDDNRALRLLQTYAEFLCERFAQCATDDWVWFEESLAYDNARLPHALICAGRFTGNEAYLSIGLDSLRWLTRRVTDQRGYFQPVGTQEFGQKFAAPAQYDQQPLEALAMIEACLAAASCDPNRDWNHHADIAYQWFRQQNDTGYPIVDEASGECFDGIGKTGPNKNRGAESVLAWQLACRQLTGI